MPGVIVEDPMVEVRLQSQRPPSRRRWTKAGPAGGIFHRAIVGGRYPSSVFAGDVLRFEGLREDCRLCHPLATIKEAEIPSYNGGKFPLSTFLAQRVREMISHRRSVGHMLPEPVQEWLRIQEWRSVIPKPGQLLVETFPRGNQALSCLLSLRGTAGAPDPGHAA